MYEGFIARLDNLRRKQYRRCADLQYHRGYETAIYDLLGSTIASASSDEELVDIVWQRLVEAGDDNVRDVARGIVEDLFPPSPPPVATATVVVPRAIAVLIDQAFLPANPAKMRSAAPEVVDAAQQFKALLAATPTPPAGDR